MLGEISAYKGLSLFCHVLIQTERSLWTYSNWSKFWLGNKKNLFYSSGSSKMASKNHNDYNFNARFYVQIVAICMYILFLINIVRIVLFMNWANSWQNQEYGICAQWRLRSACASAQYDQSLGCLHEESLATYWAHSKDSDKTGQMPRLIWVFTGPRVILLVLSWGGSILFVMDNKSGQCN